MVRQTSMFIDPYGETKEMSFKFDPLPLGGDLITHMNREIEEIVQIAVENFPPTGDWRMTAQVSVAMLNQTVDVRSRFLNRPSLMPSYLGRDNIRPKYLNRAFRDRDSIRRYFASALLNAIENIDQSERMRNLQLTDLSVDLLYMKRLL